LIQNLKDKDLVRDEVMEEEDLDEEEMVHFS
jgi:hypothetical protein